MVTKMQTSTVWIQLSKFKEEPCNLSQGPSALWEITGADVDINKKNIFFKFKKQNAHF